MGGAAQALDLATHAAGGDPDRRPAGRGQDDHGRRSSRACSLAQKKKVLLVSADVYRPAAIEQLKTLAAQVGVDFFPSAVDGEAGRHRARRRSTGRAGITTTC